MADGEKIRRPLSSLIERGLSLSVPLLSHDEWQRAVAADFDLPRTFEQALSLARSIGSPRPWDRLQRWLARVLPGLGKLWPAARLRCGTLEWQRMLTAFGSPTLTALEVDALTRELRIPAMTHAKESEHFIIRWTDRSSNPADNLTDDSLVLKIEHHLKCAWDYYEKNFGRTPFIKSGSTKLEILIYSINYVGLSDSNSPMILCSTDLVKYRDCISSIVYHELFHYLQYAFGYKTKWQPTGSHFWYFEGLPTWAEQLSERRLIDARMLTYWFEIPEQDFWDRRASAMPFWLYLASQHAPEASRPNPLQRMMSLAEPSGDLSRALRGALAEAWPGADRRGQLDSLCAQFAEAQALGSWNGADTRPLLDCTGVPIKPQLSPMVYTLRRGASAQKQSLAMGPLASCAFLIKFDAGSDGCVCRLKLRTTLGGLYKSQLWKKGERYVRRDPSERLPPQHECDLPLHLAETDSLLLILTAQDAPTKFELSLEAVTS